MVQETVNNALASNDLERAVNAANEAVKAAPTNTELRMLLVDVLIVSEQFERADKQVEILQRSQPDLAVGLGLLRGRLRAAQSRVDWFENGASPSFLDSPTERDQAAIKLCLAIKEGDAAAVENLLYEHTVGAEMTAMQVNKGGDCIFRDADDRIPHALEVLAASGDYLWIDFALVEKLEFNAPKSIRDLAWRTGILHLKEGSQSDVTVCATYYSSDADASHQLGKETSWLAATGGAMIGSGQKAMLAGDDAIFSLQLECLEQVTGT